jgi:hypothetical protein
MAETDPHTSPALGSWNPTPGDAIPWWLTEELSSETGTLLVRCFAALTAFLADELELPAGTMPALLRAAIDDYNREDGAGVEDGLRGLYEAVRVAFG